MKNMVSSSIAGTIVGSNSQAANVVAVIFLATGQDAAQRIGSSKCLTYMESCCFHKKDLYISCSISFIELGTIGGGTYLTAQRDCLEVRFSIFFRFSYFLVDSTFLYFFSNGSSNLSISTFFI